MFTGSRVHGVLLHILRTDKLVPVILTSPMWVGLLFQNSKEQTQFGIDTELHLLI